MSMRIPKLLAGAMALAGAVLPGAAPAQYRDRSHYSPPPVHHDRGYMDRRNGPAPSAYRDASRDRGNYRCNRGTGGTIIGAIAGGLLGNAVAGRGDRGVGTVAGAGAGALAGRAIDRDC